MLLQQGFTCLYRLCVTVTGVYMSVQAVCVTGTGVYMSVQAVCYCNRGLHVWAGCVLL